MACTHHPYTAQHIDQRNQGPGCRVLLLKTVHGLVLLLSIKFVLTQLQNRSVEVGLQMRVRIRQAISTPSEARRAASFAAVNCRNN